MFLGMLVFALSFNKYDAMRSVKRDRRSRASSWSVRPGFSANFRPSWPPLRLKERVITTFTDRANSEIIGLIKYVSRQKSLRKTP